MPDLQTQLRAYGQQLDERYMDVTFGEIVGRVGLVPAPRRRRPLVMALAAAAVVLLVIGGIGLLARMLSGPPPVDEPTPTTISSPPTTVSEVPVGNPWTTNQVADGVTLRDWNPPLLFDSRGLPVTAHAVGDAEAIALVRCLDVACAETESSRIEVTTSDLAMALRADDRPVLASQDGNFEGIWVIECDDPACTTYQETSVATGFSWPHVGVNVEADGSLTIAYQSDVDGLPRIVRCPDGSCAAAFEEHAVDALTGGLMNSLASASLPDGRAVLMAAFAEGQTRLAVCSDLTCTAPSEIVLDDGGHSEQTAALAVAPDGLPLVASYRAGELYVFKCHDAECTESASASLGPASSEFHAVVAPSIGFRPDGLPVVAFWDEAGDVTLAACQDGACSASRRVLFGHGGSHTLGFGQSGLPVLLYHDSERLNLASCVHPSCLEPGPAPTPTTVPGDVGYTTSVVHGEGMAGFGVSLVLDAQGLPVMAYWEAGEEAVWLARCGDEQCGAVDTQEVGPAPGLFQAISQALLGDGTSLVSYVEPVIRPDSRLETTRVQFVGPGGAITVEMSTFEMPALVVGGRGLALSGEGLPVLAYHWGNETVIETCADISCSEAGSRVVVDPEISSIGMDLTVDADGYPVLAYSVGAVRIARCSDFTCAAGASVVDLGIEGSWPRVVVGSDDLPMIFARSFDSGPALLVACEDRTCSARTVTEIPEASQGPEGAGEYLQSSSITLGGNGLPVLTWVKEGRVSVVTCAERACSTRSVQTLAPRAEFHSAAIGADGNPVIAYFTGNDLALLRCTNPGCSPSS